MNGTDYITVIASGLGQMAVLGGAAGGGFSVVKWVLEFLSKRADKKAERLDADTRFVIDNLRTEFTRVSDRLGKAEDHILDLRKSLNECEAKHSKAEAEVSRLSVLVEGYAKARQDDRK